MKSIRFLRFHTYFLVTLFVAGCGTSDDRPDLVGLGDLETMYNEIVALSESVSCENDSEWTFTAIGSKACGGPIGYIAYASTIDTENFLAKVEAYTAAQKKYNEENGIVSDCSLAKEPTGVVCQDGKPSFEYALN